MNAEIVTELLELVNMHVDHAWNGEEAVEPVYGISTGNLYGSPDGCPDAWNEWLEAAKAIRAQKSSRPDAGEIPSMQ